MYEDIINDIRKYIKMGEKIHGNSEVLRRLTQLSNFDFNSKIGSVISILNLSAKCSIKERKDDVFSRRDKVLNIATSMKS